MKDRGEKKGQNLPILASMVAAVTGSGRAFAVSRVLDAEAGIVGPEVVVDLADEFLVVFTAHTVMVAAIAGFRAADNLRAVAVSVREGLVTAG